jgi:type II secretory ATPase GspE/PulE/Tfp pilus assembly ATPase PilB-like protein
MGIESFLVASCIKGVLAQRLARTLCPECKEEYKIWEKELYQNLGLNSSDAADKEVSICKAKGCKRCMHTGFKGRLGIFELMQMTAKLNALTLGKASADEIRKAAYESGMVALRQDGLRKILQGLTTVEEVLRVA